MAEARIGILSLKPPNEEFRVDVGRVDGGHTGRERNVVEAVGGAQEVGLRRPATQTAPGELIRGKRDARTCHDGGSIAACKRLRQPGRNQRPTSSW